MSREIKFKVYYKNRQHIDTGWYCDVYMDNGIASLSPDIDWVHCQFTGLKDKNGKEIYEGDLVSSEYYQIENEEVKWFYFYWKPFEYYMSDIENRFVVVGNIYDGSGFITKSK